MIDKEKMLEELRVIAKDVFGEEDFVNNALCIQLILMVWRRLINIEEAKIVVKINQEDAEILETREKAKALEEALENSKVIEIENGEVVVEERPED